MTARRPNGQRPFAAVIASRRPTRPRLLKPFPGRPRPRPLLRTPTRHCRAGPSGRTFMSSTNSSTTMWSTVSSSSSAGGMTALRQRTPGSRFATCGAPRSSAITDNVGCHCRPACINASTPNPVSRLRGGRAVAPDIVRERFLVARLRGLRGRCPRMPSLLSAIPRLCTWTLSNAPRGTALPRHSGSARRHHGCCARTQSGCAPRRVR